MYYEISILGNALKPLTYHSFEDIKIYNLVEVKLVGKIKKGVILKKVSKPDFECLEILKIYDEFYSCEQNLLAQFISTYYICSLGEAFSIFTPFFNNMQKSEPFYKDIKLSKKQELAKQELNKHSSVLLFGDTGSGKTEIYMSFIIDTLKQNKTTILLMPEISLTPQMQKRLTLHFGSQVGIWHSKITKTKKQKILQDIFSGKIKIIAGARSSLFLPLKDIGLIIVDEEHDDSYKSNQKPKYNAKNLALMYGKFLNAKVILGSATPSLTAWHKLPCVRLKGTFHESKKEFIFERALSEITPYLLQTIKQTLDEQKQVICFVPTRANFKYITCKKCFQSISCPFCSVSLSLHQKHNYLKCHYCNYTSQVFKQCPSCSHEMLVVDRIGTQEVAKILQENFNDKQIAIFDKDNINTAKKLNELLKNFNDKNIDILVGTQMLSKGHDYHNVALSVILGIDYLYFMPDFQARQKALSLALQIAGRSGRKGLGKVFIQTANEDFFKLYLNDYDGFLEEEIQLRKELYPPFKKLLRFEISHKKEEICTKVCEKLVCKIKSLPLDVSIIGYGKSNIQKIANKYRYEILLRSLSSKALIQTASLCKENFIQADMDPVHFG